MNRTPLAAIPLAGLLLTLSLAAPLHAAEAPAPAPPAPALHGGSRRNTSSTPMRTRWR